MSPPIDLNDPIAVLLAASEAVASAGDLALSIAATSTCLNALRSAGLDGTVSFDGAGRFARWEAMRSG